MHCRSRCVHICKTNKVKKSPSWHSAWLCVSGFMAGLFKTNNPLGVLPLNKLPIGLLTDYSCEHLAGASIWITFCPPNILDLLFYSTTVWPQINIVIGLCLKNTEGQHMFVVNILFYNTSTSIHSGASEGFAPPPFSSQPHPRCSSRTHRGKVMTLLHSAQYWLIRPLGSHEHLVLSLRQHVIQQGKVWVVSTAE